MQAFSSCGEKGLLFIAMLGLLIGSGFSCCQAQALDTWASVIAALRLWGSGLVILVHGLGCSKACGIFLDQGLNPCPLCC